MNKDLKPIQTEILKLRTEIQKHDYKYYILDAPDISDSEYDALFTRLKQLENLHPELITQDSPTQRVSGFAKSSFEPVKHTVPMLSLDNTYNNEEVIEWHARVSKNLNNEHFDFVVEVKIDGVSLSLTYKKGLLTKAATRGDGETGEDITANARTIKSVPLKLLTENPPEVLEIRGEVFINKQDFISLNESLIKQGIQNFANPRNCAAGSLRQKDSSISAQRPLKFFIHSYGSITGEVPFDSHKSFLNYSNSLGMPLDKNTKVYSSINEALKYLKHLEEIRDSLDFEIDGAVLKVNSIDQQKTLGFTMRSPRWAIAYKFKARQATSKIKAIRFQVGRTGIITPVADLEPVQIGGVTVSHATLHNFDEVKRLDVRKGDTVLVERAGDVIPKISQVILSKRENTAKPLVIPEMCPSCSQSITKEKDEDVAYRCLNPSCPAQIEQGVLHFSKREAMDIESLGEIAVKQLLEKKLVSSLADIYRLKEADLLQLELFKEKKAANLLKAIEKSKNQPLNRLIYGLGIRNVGEKASETLADKFKTLNSLMHASFEELTSINEIGPIVAKSINDYFSQKSVQTLLNELIEQGLNTIQPEKDLSRQPLKGKSFVLTGELSSMPRTDAENKIKQLGGKASSSVSKKTDFLVAGASPGSKLKNAEKLGVKIINETEFLKLLKGE